MREGKKEGLPPLEWGSGYAAAWVQPESRKIMQIFTKVGKNTLLSTYFSANVRVYFLLSPIFCNNFANGMSVSCFLGDGRPLSPLCFEEIPWLCTQRHLWIWIWMGNFISTASLWKSLQPFQRTVVSYLCTIVADGKQKQQESLANANVKRATAVRV